MANNTVKLIPLGGQAEMGKSMYCLEIDDACYIIDCGYRFPEVDKLGVDIIIPSYDYLKTIKEKIKAIFITHGHDDVMGGLPYLLQEINVPIYTTQLTGDLVDQMLKRYLRHSNVEFEYNIKVVNMNDSLKLDTTTVEFFPITHSIPGSVGLAFSTSHGYIVYSSEYIIDFGAPDRFRCNIQKMMEIGKKGVLALLCESSYSKNSGYTSPKHKLTDLIEPVFEESTGRIIIASYAQNVFRTQEIAQLARKYNRKIIFYGKDKYDNTNTLIRLSKSSKKPILDIDPAYIGTNEDIIKEQDSDKIVVLLSGGPRHIYHDILDIINGGDDLLKLLESDTFILASPILPGTEKIANRAINELYKTDTNIQFLKTKELMSMHASEEDIKVLVNILNPKYFVPVKGEYQHFISCSDVVKKMSITDDKVAIVDNGEVITFKDGKLLAYRDTFIIEDVMIDGIGVGDVGAKVIDDRNQLQKDGVVIIGMTIDENKDIVCSTDVQTRGFVYLKDSENIVQGIMQIAENELAAYKQTPYMDIGEVRQMIKDKSFKFILKETGKKPVILPVIIEI